MMGIGNKNVAAVLAGLAFFAGVGLALLAGCPPGVTAFRGLVVAVGTYGAVRLVDVFLVDLVMEELIQLRLREEGQHGTTEERATADSH
jgi:hypothetical protein